MRDVSKIKSVVIKIGSSSLCDASNKINKEKILKLINQIAILKRRGLKVTLVSSGAIMAGMDKLGLETKPTNIPQKQALAAIGQASLMQIYEDLFELFDLKCAQVLLNHDDFGERMRLLNLTNALNSMFEYDVIPIINENDTLAVDEIKVGDNDTLAALMVPMVDGDLLVLVSDINGLYDDNPHTNPEATLIHNVVCIDDSIRSMAKDPTTKVGTGGMVTKIKAAKIVNDYGCAMAIVNGQQPDVIVDLLDGEIVGTWFDGKAGRTLTSRQHWLFHRSSPKGKIVVDKGAAKALLEKHTSLLPKGIIDVTGDFLMSAVVEIVDQQGKVLARGQTNYSSDEIRLIKGLKTDQIEAVLHYKDYDTIIHANNLVLNKE
ncbi:MAG: glutamate 5-kinase [Erysipelotrichaceae bacterium]|nr:glutamate 5-kinase [Erysipelotrichaceae bacterium]MDD3809183.1 glutamate 5-kinase [Erysipelotrichaceae bacterium]